MARVTGEGEKRVRKEEGVEAVVGRGRSGEGEKSVRIGQVAVSVTGVGGILKEHRKEKEKEVVSSPVLTKVKDWRPRERKKEEDVIYLDVDEEGRTTRVTKEEMDQQVLLEYKSDPADRDWACSCIVATVIMEETILAIQNRVEDAGFDDVEVIPMGGDKVFLRCHSNDDVLKVFNYASEFFSMFLLMCINGRLRIYGMNVVHGYESMVRRPMLGIQTSLNFVSQIMVRLFRPAVVL